MIGDPSRSVPPVVGPRTAARRRRLRSVEGAPGSARRQYLAWRGAAFAIPALPSAADPFLARALGGLAYACASHARDGVRANLSVIAPSVSRDEREALVRRAFVNQARNYLMTLRLPRLELARVARSIDLTGWAHVDAARAARRGVIFASAHFGPIALVGPVALAAHGLRVSIVAEAISPRLFDLINRHLRGSLGASFVLSSQVVSLARMLHRGEAIGVLADRPVAGARMRVAFFGRETLLPVGHLALASRTGAALLPSFALAGRRPRGEVLPPLELVEGRGDDVLRENVGRWARVLERVIARAPEEWHVFERFWD